MANPYFDVRYESTTAGRYTAGPVTAGPWDPGQQHGGPPNALVVRAAERLAAAEAADAAWHAMRLASEFVGPVPVGELSTEARTVRVARSAVLVAVTLRAGGRDCLHSRVWLVRDRDTAAVAHDGAAPPAPPDGEPGFSLHFPYADSIDWYEVSGTAMRPGPAAVWARPRVPLVAGEQPSGLQRVVLVGDSASGVSAALDWARWTFLNVDLDVHLARPFHGEWVHLDAATQVGNHGAALARATVSDQDGPVGTTAQTLLVAPRAQ